MCVFLGRRERKEALPRVGEAAFTKPLQGLKKMYAEIRYRQSNNRAPAPPGFLLLGKKIAFFQVSCYHIHGMVNFRLPRKYLV